MHPKQPSFYLIILLPLLCYLSWIGIIFYLDYTPAIIMLVVCSVFSHWQQIRIPNLHRSPVLAGSLLGALSQAILEDTSFYHGIGPNLPLRGDNDGLFVLIFPYMVFVWVVASSVGYILYRIEGKIKGVPHSDKSLMIILRNILITVGVIAALQLSMAFDNYKRVNSPGYKAFLEAMEYKPKANCVVQSTEARHIKSGETFVFSTECIPKGWENININTKQIE